MSWKTRKRGKPRQIGQKFKTKTRYWRPKYYRKPFSLTDPQEARKKVEELQRAFKYGYTRKRRKAIKMALVSAANKALANGNPEVAEIYRKGYESMDLNNPTLLKTRKKDYPYQKLLPYGTPPDVVVKNMDLIHYKKDYEDKAKKAGKVHWSVYFKDDLIPTGKGKVLTPDEIIEASKKKDICLAVWEDDRKYVLAWVDPHELHRNDNEIYYVSGKPYFKGKPVKAMSKEDFRKWEQTYRSHVQKSR